MYPVHASGCFSVCDRLAGIFPDKGESTATVCADMDQKASGIHHLRSGAGRMKIFNLYILEILILFTILKKFPLII